MIVCHVQCISLSLFQVPKQINKLLGGKNNIHPLKVLYMHMVWIVYLMGPLINPYRVVLAICHNLPPVLMALIHQKIEGGVGYSTAGGNHLPPQGGPLLVS